MRPKPTNMGHPMFMFQADLPMGWHIPNLKPLGLSNSPTAIMTADVPKMWLSHQHHQLFRTASDEAGDSLADSAGEGSCASSQLFHAVSKTTFTTLTSFFLWITIQIYIYIYIYIRTDGSHADFTKKYAGLSYTVAPYICSHGHGSYPATPPQLH